MGYLPEAMVNFMAFLGWNPGDNREIFSLEQLGKEFCLEKVQKGGAVFNPEKLNWYNAYYLRQLDLDKLTELCIPYLIKDGLIKPKFELKQEPPAYGGYFIQQKYIIAKTGEEIPVQTLKQIIDLEGKRIQNLSQISEVTEFFFTEPKYKPELLIWDKMKNTEILNMLKLSYLILCDIKPKDFSLETIKEKLMEEAEKQTAKDKKIDRGRLLWPLRVALCGREKSPSPFEIAAILGKEKTLKRIEKAQKLIKK